MLELGGPGSRKTLITALACGLLALAVLQPPEVHAWSRAACKVVLAAAACLVLSRGAGAPRLLPRWIWGLLPFGAAAVLSAACRSHALDEASDALALVLAVVLGRAIAADARARDVMTRLFVALACVVALRAVVQRYLTYPLEAEALRTGRAEGSAYVLARLELGRPSGPFTLPAALGGFLALTLPLTLVLAATERRTAPRATLALAGLLQMAALALTCSVGALFATAISVLLVLPALPSRRRALLQGAIAAATIAGAVLFLHARRLEIATPGGDPLLLRAGNWMAATKMIRDHPLLGTGPGSFGTFYPRYIQPGMNETRYAHNSYLQVLAGWGAWAALPILALLTAVSGKLRAARRAADGNLPALAAAGGFLAHNLVDFTAFLPGVAIPAAILIGLGVGEGESGASPPRRRPARALLAGLALAGLAAFVMQAVAVARSQFLLEQASAAAVDGDIAASLELARAAARVRPEDEAPQAFVAEGVLAHGMGDSGLRAEGQRAAARAVDLDRESAILHFLAARYHQAAGETAEAYRELCAAHRLYPLKELYRPGAESVVRKDAP